MRASLVVSSLLLLAAAVACSVGDGPALDDVCDGGSIGDDGACANAENDGDEDGGDKSPVGSGDCLSLVVKACGPASECDPDPGCRAATLLTEFQPEGCSTALADNRGYPTCAVGSCEELVEKVCGIDDGCSADAACEPALVLQERADEGDVSATASCGQALADELVFPRCTN